MLRIENLTKTYGEKRAVDNLSLHIAPGEIYGFIGHNGAGKTTTLKAVVGILQFDKGEVFIKGESIRKNPLACKQKIAYIPDNPDLYEFMTGIKFLNFIADIFGVPEENTLVINEIPSLTDLAALINVHRTNVSTYINELEKMQIIERQKKALIIKDLQALQRKLDETEAE